MGTTKSVKGIKVGESLFGLLFMVGILVLVNSIISYISDIQILMVVTPAAGVILLTTITTLLLEDDLGGGRYVGVADISVTASIVFSMYHAVVTYCGIGTPSSFTDVLGAILLCTVMTVIIVGSSRAIISKDMNIANKRL